jgi:CrcB protein
MLSYFWIGIGSAIGGMTRHWCGVASTRIWGVDFPWGTIAINVSGSFVIGAFAVLTDIGGKWPLSVTARQFVMIGICGGFTTFSSFSLQTLVLMREGRWLEAGLNIVLSVVLCLVAVALGHVGASALN